MKFRAPFARWFALLFLLTASAWARDAFVVFSGGGTPLTNNYSQYLQARALSAFLLARYPADSVWVFFGAGNREGQPPVFSDVRQQVKQDGLILESWLPGVLPHNRPADKASLLGALRDEVLPAVRDGGILYLFVGDHGTQQKDGARESLVTLWQMKQTPPRGWRTDMTEELSVSELQAVLAAGLGRGRVVFCMTQCHSGGFHHLGVPREMQPDLAWFSGVVPDWAAPVEAAPLPRVAGFTATDEDSLAAGCDPDPDPDKWAGYERYVPEALLGLDLFSGTRTRPELPSFAAAHREAVLADQTIDKPRRTSEQYLERWAALIERLAAEQSLTPAVRAAADAYARAVDAGLADGPGAEFAARRAEFAAFIQRMGEQNSSLAALVDHGDRAALEGARGTGGGRPSAPVAASQPASPLAQEWKNVVRPAWKAAVAAGTVAGLKGPALAFEKYLLAQEDRGRDVMFPRGWQNPMLNDIFWQSGSAIPAEKDPAKAEAVARWAAERRTTIAAWASASPDAAIKAAGARLKPRGLHFGGPRALSAPIAAERTLFYRRTLAAWAFLQAVGHEEALGELHRLIALENLALPPARAAASR